MPTSRSIHDDHASLAIQQTMEVRREEYLDYMTFRANRRPLFTELFGPIVGLKEEWLAQGATPDDLNLAAYRYRRAQFGTVPVNTGWLGGEELECILEETPDEIIARDRMGRRLKLCRGYATVPLPLDFPVRNWQDWRRVRAHYEFSEARFAPNWEQIAREHLSAGRVLTVNIPGGFDEPRELMGDAALCVAYYEQPDLIHDILDTIAETAYHVLEHVTSIVPIDQLSVHEDLAGKSGPLIGPRQMKEYVTPYYRRLWDLASSRGARTFILDSDGYIEPVLRGMVDGGINVVYPMEPAAGEDVVKTRQVYGASLAFMGGIDKHVVRRTPAEIVAELEYKIPPIVATGGCVLSLDHRIPNGTPLANYRFYIDKAWEILEREAGKLA